MHLFHRLKKLSSNQSGVTSIEFAMAAFGFFIIIALVYDFYTTQALHGKLERATYSSASLFRERSALYNNRLAFYEAIDQQQARQLSQLVQQTMESHDIEVRVEALYISERPAFPQNLRQAKLTLVSFCGSDSCNNDFFSTQELLSDFTYLSAYSVLYSRWIPLYRVTACMPGQVSMFQRIMNGVSNNQTVTNHLCSSSIVVSRCNLTPVDPVDACAINRSFL